MSGSVLGTNRVMRVTFGSIRCLVVFAKVVEILVLNPWHPRLVLKYSVRIKIVIVIAGLAPSCCSIACQPPLFLIGLESGFGDDARTLLRSVSCIPSEAMLSQIP